VLRASGSTVSARLESWAEILAGTHLRFDVRATERTPEAFRGAVTSRSVGELMLADCAAQPFLGRRDRAMIGTQREDRCPREDVLGFQFVLSGVELVRERARQLALSAGDVVLWDGLEPTDVEIVAPFRKRTLLIPRERALAACPRLGEVGALPPLKRCGPARLLVRYMNALAAEPQLDGPAGAAAASAALELLRAAVEPEVPSDREATRAAMRAEIRAYVRAHLRDPMLCPASIARAWGISLRALHALFEDAETSVASLVRRERLARCAEDLRRPNAGTVTEIAFRWGFSDAAHFARVFKREFGLTPSEFRRQALLAAAA